MAEIPQYQRLDVSLADTVPWAQVVFYSDVLLFYENRLFQSDNPNRLKKIF